MTEKKEQKETALEVPVQKQYKLELNNSSEIDVNISVNIKALNRKDFEDILTEYAKCTHNFYLYLAEHIKNML